MVNISKTIVIHFLMTTKKKIDFLKNTFCVKIHAFSIILKTIWNFLLLTHLSRYLLNPIYTKNNP